MADNNASGVLAYRAQMLTPKLMVYAALVAFVVGILFIQLPDDRQR